MLFLLPPEGRRWPAPAGRMREPGSIVLAGHGKSHSTFVSPYPRPEFRIYSHSRSVVKCLAEQWSIYLTIKCLEPSLNATTRSQVTTIMRHRRFENRIGCLNRGRRPAFAASRPLQLQYFLSAFRSRWPLKLQVIIPCLEPGQPPPRRMKDTSCTYRGATTRRATGRSSSVCLSPRWGMISPCMPWISMTAKVGAPACCPIP